MPRDSRLWQFLFRIIVEFELNDGYPKPACIYSEKSAGMTIGVYGWLYSYTSRTVFHEFLRLTLLQLITLGWCSMPSKK